MKKEFRTIINLIRNLNIKSINDENFQFDFFINSLIYHKIFVHYYSKIRVALSSSELIKKIDGIYNIFVFNRIKYIVFVKELINCLSKVSIFYIYKGFPLECIIYGGKFKRQYTDIDILVDNYEDIEKFKKEIRSSFICNDFNNYTDFLGETKIGVLYNGTDYTVEFKTKNHFLKIGKIEKSMNINNKGINVNTLALEETFLQLITYYYEFTENIQMIYVTKKCKLQYALDLYVFIKKYKREINWYFVKEKAQKNHLVHKIRIAIINIMELFNDASIAEILDIFQVKLINYINSDILDVGRINWNISVVDRFLFADEIAVFLKKYSEGKFWLSEYNKNFYNYNIIKSDIFKNIKFKVLFKDNEIKFVFLNNVFLSGNFVILINIYAYRKSGEYIAPYIPVCLRKNNDNILISRVPPTCRSTFDSKLERESDISKQRYIIVEEEKNKLNVKILLEKTPYDIDCKKIIGFNVVIYELEGNYIKKNWSLIPHYDLPVILSKDR